MSWIETKPYWEISSPCHAIFAQTCQNHSASLKNAKWLLRCHKLLCEFFVTFSIHVFCFRFKKSSIFFYPFFSLEVVDVIVLFSGLLIRWTFLFILWKWKHRHVELIVVYNLYFAKYTSFFLLLDYRDSSEKYTINFVIVIMNSEFGHGFSC